MLKTVRLQRPELEGVFASRVVMHGFYSFEIPSGIS